MGPIASTDSSPPYVNKWWCAVMQKTVDIVTLFIWQLHMQPQMWVVFYDCATLRERLDSILNTALSAANMNHRLIACVSIDDQPSYLIIVNINCSRALQCVL